MKKILMTLLKVIIISCIISLGLMALFSFVMLKAGVADSSLKVFVILVYAISTFVGGLIIGKVMENRKFLWGMGSGMLYFAIILILSIIFTPEGSAAGIGLVACLITCMAGGTIGGMAG